MASFNIEDYDSSINLALFRDDYTRFSALINPKNYPQEQVPPMYIRGKMELRYGTQDQWEMKIKTMEPLAQVADKLSKGVRVKLDLRTVTGPMIDRLQEAIEHSKGSKRLEIQFVEPHERLAVDMFSRRFQIEPKTFIDKMHEFELDVCSLI
jgi:DNA polymerase-3 subunit alpha